MYLYLFVKGVNHFLFHFPAATAAEAAVAIITYHHIFLLLTAGTHATASPESARRAIMMAVGSEVLGVE